jgi:glycosyltransferase involved in cell wall biosynthesis
MRILLPIHQYLPHNRSGTEVYTHSLAGELGQRHDVLVYCHEPSMDGGERGAREEPYQGVAVRRVAAYSPGGSRGPWAAFRRDYANPLIEADFSHTLDRFHPDIVHVQHLKGLSAGIMRQCARRGIPVVMTLHDYWLVCANAQCVRPDGILCTRTHARLECAQCAAARAGVPALRWAAPVLAAAFLARDAAIRRALRPVGRFVSPSHFLKARLVAAGWPEARITVMENGLDKSRLATSRAASRGAWRGHYTYIGSLAWQKGVDLLVRAFGDPSLSAARLRVWGSPAPFPSYAGRLSELATAAPNVSLEGEADDRGLDAALAWADYLVVPSLWWENSPVAIQEAYAAGVPVIASRLGALEEKVRDGVSGLLFEPGDVVDLARVLRRTIDEPELLPRLRAGIPPIVTIADHAARIEALYAEVIDEIRGRSAPQTSAP